MLAAAVCLKSTAWRIASWMGIHQAFYQLVWSKNPAVLHSDMPEYCILSVWGLLFDNPVFKEIFFKKPFTISPAPVYTLWLVQILILYYICFAPRAEHSLQAEDLDLFYRVVCRTARFPEVAISSTCNQADATLSHQLLLLQLLQ